MSEQSTGETRTTQSSYRPVVALALVIALCYARGIGLVLLGAVG